jgi:hypothetical protein
MIVNWLYSSPLRVNYCENFSYFASLIVASAIIDWIEKDIL